jgi:biopolymer transport protein ExbD
VNAAIRFSSFELRHSFVIRISALITIRCEELFSAGMKLSRTTNYNFGWLLLIGLVNVAFLLVFFLLLSSNFILQQGISVSMPFSRFTLGPQTSRQIISITGGAVPAIYFQDQRVTMEQLGPLLDAAKRRDESIIIKADRSTSYETVAEVANAALEHGITSVALAATPPQ